MERRLALVRSLLKANPLFDKVTKTESIFTLLSLDYNNTTVTNTNTSDSNDNDDRIQQEDNQNMILWGKHVTFFGESNYCWYYCCYKYHPERKKNRKSILSYSTK